MCMVDFNLIKWNKINSDDSVISLLYWKVICFTNKTNNPAAISQKAQQL